MLSLIPLKDWIYVTVIGALIFGFGAYTVHERHIGAAHEVAALKASSDKLQADTDRQTADLKAKATMADQTHAKEILALTNRAPVQSVRVCLDTHSRAVVPSSSGQVAGNVSPSATPTNIQPMPSGDNSGREGTAGPDISELLGLLAFQGDTSDATLREFQSR